MKFYQIILFSFLISMATGAIGADGYVKGKIQYIRTHEATHQGWQPPLFWFTLKEVKTGNAGSCPDWHGNILFVADTDQAYSMVLGAYMADKEIAVRYDDAKRTSGFCKTPFITLGDPAPLY